MNKENSKFLLEVKNLSVVLDGRKILDNVSFVVEKGQLISLIGLNGSGKTTLLKTIAGLIEPVQGEIVKNSEQIFYIPQRSDLDTSFPLTVRECCELFGAKDYRHFLTRTGMRTFEEHFLRNLSGGQFQRVLMAIALSRKPDLLLLDELTAGIDLAGEESFYQLVKELREEFGTSIILVSHNIHLVISNADKVLCLAGHLCCTGAPQEITGNTDFQRLFGKHLQPYLHRHDHVH